jgi:phage terminase large subunit-like protein
MTLDPWQVYALDRMLEHDADMQLLASTVLLSVARQNGKSVIVRAVVGWILDEGYKWDTFRKWDFILLAAHDAKQARIPYDYIRRDVMSYADINTWGHSARRQGVSRARATQYTGIELNGVRVDVATSQPGSARGISPGLVCFDEVLTQTTFETYEVLSPAQVAIPNSQMLMTSTAGFADSVVLRAMYDRLYRQSTGAEQPDPTFLGLWWRADDDDVTPQDWDQVVKANPALAGRGLSRKMIENEYLILPRGSWIRERLNRWHDERVDAPFSIAAWGACRVVKPLDPFQVSGNYVIAADVTSTWGEGSIIVSAMRKDGKVGVEVHRHLLSRTDVPLKASDFTREIATIAKKVRVDAIVYSASSALAPAFERHAVESMLPYTSIPATRLLMACSDFAEAVTSRRVAHDDPFLDTQIATAQRRFVGSDGAWRWTISKTPVTAVMSATMGVAVAAKSFHPVQVFM